jgi:hypothetical protein
MVRLIHRLIRDVISLAPYPCFLTLGLCAGNTEKCSQDDDFVYCYCCYYSLMGAVCPCYIAIPKKIQG